MGGLSDQHVFGYASLVLDDGGRGTPARLPGYRRVWGVATDNVRAIPGYKMYLSRADGSRPAVYVAFIDLEPDPGCAVNGVARPISRRELDELDRRERNYDRVEVSEQIEGVEGTVWTYRGSREGRERLLRGRAEGRAVVSRDYYEKVRRGFAALGEDQERAFAESSSLEDLPVWDLERIDLPADAPAAEEGA